jgi:hypothetical protein
MDQNKLPLDKHYLGVPSGVPKAISKPVVDSSQPCTYLAPRLTLSPNRPKWATTSPTSPRSTIGCVQNDFQANSRFGANRAPIGAETNTISKRIKTSFHLILRRDWHYLQIVWNDLPLDLRHLGVPYGVPNSISEPMVHLAQTWHLSCLKINTISEGTEMSFH